LLQFEGVRVDVEHAQAVRPALGLVDVVEVEGVDKRVQVEAEPLAEALLLLADLRFDGRDPLANALLLGGRRLLLVSSFFSSVRTRSSSSRISASVAAAARGLPAPCANAPVVDIASSSAAVVAHVRCPNRLMRSLPLLVPRCSSNTGRVRCGGHVQLRCHGARVRGRIGAGQVSGRRARESFPPVRKKRAGAANCGNPRGRVRSSASE